MPQSAQPKNNVDNIVETKRTIITLNSLDSLYAEIRDKNYNAVSFILSRTAKELQQAYDVSTISMNKSNVINELNLS